MSSMSVYGQVPQSYGYNQHRQTQSIYAGSHLHQQMPQPSYPRPAGYGYPPQMQPQPMSQYSIAAGVGAHKVLAERYKTKMCRNYIEMGMCPYESRCMFAHGEHELRTTEMNLRDGLVTEETIKAFKRFLHLRRMGIEVLPPSHAVHWADAAAPEPQRDLNVAGSKLHVAAAEDASPSASVSDSLWYRWCPYSTSNSVVYFRDHEDSSDRSSHQGHDLHDHRSNVEFDHTDESSSESSIPATPTLGSGPNQFPQVGPFEGSSYEI